MATAKKAQSVRERLIATKSQRFGKHEIEIDGLDMPLYVRELSAAAVSEITASLSPEQVELAERAADGDEEALQESAKSGIDTVAPWLMAALVDEDVEPVFGKGDEDLILELFTVKQAQHIMSVILDVNDLRKKPEEEKNG